jgi:hypothetical protein
MCISVTVNMYIIMAYLKYRYTKFGTSLFRLSILALCRFLFTVAVLRVCCYRAAKLCLHTVELDYKVTKGIIVLLQLSVVPTADYNVTENSD